MDNEEATVKQREPWEPLQGVDMKRFDCEGKLRPAGLDRRQCAKCGEVLERDPETGSWRVVSQTAEELVATG